MDFRARSLAGKTTNTRLAQAKRVFFYDCIDDEKQPGETEGDFQKRITSQEAFFTTLGKLRGFHIRQGSLKDTGKKRRQKEVDVLLATDMLTHGYDGNMETAVLIAGDLDFRPVVESLVRRGVFVEVWYEPTSASAETSVFGTPDFPSATVGESTACRPTFGEDFGTHGVGRNGRIN